MDLRCRFPFLFILFLFSHLTTSAQFYEYGQDACSLRWNQFESEHYSIIYPQGIDSLAMTFADKLEYFYPYQSEVMDHEAVKIPLILHNESSISNGLTVWAPKRIEVFTNPDPNGYPQDWMTQLALHEVRHAFQVSKLNQGISHVMSVFAGEQTIGLITGFLPYWYLEGDAVDAETRFSKSGRGRLPSFEMGTKAILIERGEAYPFSKAVLGSYKSYVPNHYEIGYLIVHYGRRTYGNDFWTDMEDYAARKPYLINPGYFSMKSYGVVSKSVLYDSAVNMYGQHWKSNYEKRDIQSVKSWSSINNKFYTNYHFPQYLYDTKLIALKTGIDQIPEFVTIDSTGWEKRVFRPGIMNSGRFSFSHGMIAWDEWVPDIRWKNRSYSLIRVYDLNKKEVRNLGKQTRYFNPALAKGGDMIAAIEQRTDQTFYLAVLGMDGTLLELARAPSGFYIQDPQWMDKDSALIVTATDFTGEYLYSYSIKKKSWTELYYSGRNDISYPVVDGENIYFGSTVSGIDNIYRFNVSSDSLFRVTSAAFGAFEPCIDTITGNLLFADYHSNGYRAVSVNNILGTENPVLNQNDSGEQIDSESTSWENNIIDKSYLIQGGHYEPAPYRKLFHSVNIHSWLPLYFDYMNPEAALSPEKFPVSIGATLLSQNLLSTVTGMLGYEYTDKTHFLHSGIRLEGKLPVFDININYGGLPGVYKINQKDSVPIDFKRFTFSSNTYIPFRLNTGKYISYIQALFGYRYTTDLFPNADANDYESGVHWMHYKLYISSYLRKSKKDIIPRFGFSAFSAYRNAPFNRYNFGSLFSEGLTLYLPGIGKHQAIRLRQNYQKQIAARYLFNNDISIPRGIDMIRALQLNLYSMDYTFPLAYPDLNIESIFYLKRISGNIWADYMQGKNVYNDKSANSLDRKDFFTYGMDVLFDFHLFRIYFPLSMGSRISYRPETNSLLPEFLFSININ